MPFEDVSVPSVFTNSFYQGIIILRPTMQVEQPVNSSRRIQRYLQTIVDKVGRQNFGLIIMIISQIIWPLSFVYPSQTRMNPVETNLMRAIVTLISHYFIIDYFGMSFSLKSPTNFRIMLLRNFITCIHQFALTGAPFFLPFSIVFTLNSSSVLFVFILDYFIFKVEINKQQAIGVILGFLGVLLTVNGQFFVDLLYPDFEKETKFENYVTDDPYIKLLAGIILIAANFGRAFSICITKWLKKVNGTQLSFYFGIILLFECSMLYPVAVAKPSELPVMEWSIIFSAIPQNIVQLLFLSALLLSKNTGILNLMCFVSIAVGYLVSLIRYQEKINLVCFAGVLLILYGLIKTIANRQKH